MIPRPWLGVLARWMGYPARPCDAWLGPVAPRPRGAPEVLSAALARTRRPGRGGPWLPPALCRPLRSPGCRQYGMLLAATLRAAGHEAVLWVGAGPHGAHVWVECRGRAYDLAHPGGVAARELRDRYVVRTCYPSEARTTS